MESGQERRAKVRRVESIIDAISQGASTPQEIEQKLWEERLQAGEKAEKRAMDVIRELQIVRQVRKATTEENQERKIDIVVYFERNTRHPPVAIQVKSSERGLQEFLKTVKPEERIIGLNTGVGVSDRYVQQNFLRQLAVLDPPRQRG